ncbi:hypothetical protein FDECE_8797 [Fusarium decemcellulare]|nr:hypothetical protein FDECE_8797 [Fusarium decemcellulare]
MGHTSDSEPPKRKRDVDDAGGQPGRAQHAPASIQQGIPSYIHYLPRSNASHLSLIQGDGDTFADIISLIGDYEAVLDRHESLASSLGAKLTGPRLLRGIEKFFDGPIKTTPLQPFSNPISWLDVVSYAKSNPKDFTLVHKPDGSRCCQFVLKGSQVEITEDDWRLVWSGALDRFPLDHPLEEDETAEAATLDILEQRTSILYKKADEVAARARILNHRLGQRKQDILRRRSAQAQDTSPSRFQPNNVSQRGSNFGSGYDLHADLLQQFLTASASPPPSRSTSVTGVPLTSLSQPSPSHSTTHTQSHAPRYSGHTAETVLQPAVDSREAAFRSLITQRTDQLGKGDTINPPWKTVTDEEFRRIKREMGLRDEMDIDGQSEVGPGMDTLDTRDPRANRLGDRHDAGRTSGDRTPGTLGTEDGSRPPSRGDGHPPTTMEPSAALMNRFDLTAERHRLPFTMGQSAGSDHGSRASELKAGFQLATSPDVPAQTANPHDESTPDTTVTLTTKRPISDDTNASFLVDIGLEPLNMSHHQPTTPMMTRRDERPFHHSEVPMDHAALIQSRETGDVLPDDTPVQGNVKALPFAKSWVHMFAGGVGGMTAAAMTAPLDVLKTRLQSDFYQAQIRAAREAQGQVLGRLNPARAALYHLNDTLQILGSVYRTEGWRALFKGLGPNMVGVVPARAINFYVYGNGKRIISQHLNHGEEAPWVHLSAGVAAGVVTSTATNPIWMVKTRLQLDKNVAKKSGGAQLRKYRNSYDCVRQIVRDEGIRSLYRGMSASYLGVVESTMQWMLYEQMKASLARRENRIIRSGREKTWWDKTIDWTGKGFSAGSAKLVAAVIAYPHEVARTRLRQAPMDNGLPKYTGLVQCFKLVWVEEGLMGLYGGLTPHLMRTVPSAAIMFAMYEGILRLFHTPA